MTKGAWEVTPGPNLFIAIPAKGSVDVSWAIALSQVLRQSPPHILSANSAPAVDWARNVLVETFLSYPSCEWMLWLDTDVMPPADVIARLMAHKLPVVSALYRARNPAYASQSMWPIVAGFFDRQVVNGRENLVVKEIADWHPGEVLQVDAVGMGCVLMHRRVLEAIKPPWFNYTMRYRWLQGEQYERDDWVSEDWYFWKKAKEAGFSVYVDTTVECTHITLANITGRGQILAGGLK